MKKLLFFVLFFLPFGVHAEEIPKETIIALHEQLITIQSTLEKLKSIERVEFSDLPLALQKVAICESGARHFASNGKVIISKTNDAGIMQINLGAHAKTAKGMGLNLMNPNDNMKFALWLYSLEGLNPWVCAHKLKMV